jgi:two-component system, chemotaxis family, chemotaxis protein CheY
MRKYDLSRLDIMVVEDNAFMQALLREILRAFGVTEIAIANSADKAWTMLQAKPCDMLLVDWDLAGTSGCELTRRIRQAEDSPAPFVPIIMITSFTDKEHIFEARDAGVTELLAKPVSAVSIYSRMVAAIEKPRRFVRTATYIGPDRRRHFGLEYSGPERRAGPAEGAATEEAPRPPQLPDAKIAGGAQ